jgi:OTU domain-containing protein 6
MWGLGCVELASVKCIFSHLVAKVLGLKKSCAKGDKKKKKEVTEEIARLEAELDKRHDEELLSFKAQQPSEVSVT